jgi:HEAT repeat protein
MRRQLAIWAVLFLVLTIGLVSLCWNKRTAAERDLSDLANGDPTQRLRAASRLGDVKQLSSIQPLLRHAQTDEVEGVRAACKDALLQMLSSPEASVRCSAIEALGSLPGESTSNALLRRILVDEDTKVRSTAVTSIQRLNKEQSFDLLVKKLDSDYHANVLQALSEYSEDMWYHLITALTNQSASVRDGLEGVLGKIAAGKFEFLTNSLTHQNPLVRSSLAVVLGNLGDLRASTPLTKLLTDNDSTVQWNAAHALIKLNNEEGTAYFVKHLTIQSDAGPAATILASRGWSPKTEEEQIHFKVGKRDSSALFANWTTTKRVLVADLQSSDRDATKNAVYALIGLSREETVEDLKSFILREKTPELVEVLLNSGHPELNNTAKQWARQRGYTINENPLLSPDLRWRKKSAR